MVMVACDLLKILDNRETFHGTAVPSPVASCSVDFEETDELARETGDVECEYFMISGWNKSKNIVDLNFSSFKTLGPK